MESSVVGTNHSLAEEEWKRKREFEDQEVRKHSKLDVQFLNPGPDPSHVNVTAFVSVSFLPSFVQECIFTFRRKASIQELNPRFLNREVKNKSDSRRQESQIREE